MQKNMIDWLIEVYDKIPDKSLARIVITISIFFLGLLFQRLFKLITLELNRFRIRKAFIITIRDFEDTLSKQSKEFDNALQNFTMEYNTDFPYRKYPFLYYKRVYSEGFKNTYNAFFGGIRGLILRSNRQFRIKLFNQVWDSLEASQIAVSHFSNEVGRISNIYFESSKRRNSYNEDVRKKLSHLQNTNPSVFSTIARHKDFLQGILNIQWSIGEISTPSSIEVQEKYILPLIEHMKLYGEFNDAIKMLDYLFPASREFKSMKHAMRIMNRACFHQHIYFKTLAKKSKMFLIVEENQICISKCLR